MKVICVFVTVPERFLKMPGHCCVPGCRGNYDGEKNVRVFTFPADADRRRRWLKAIPRAGFEPGKRAVVSLKRLIFIARRLCGDTLNCDSSKL